MSRPVRVCFVCSGNICRSPTAEVVARELLAQAGLADRVEVDSAGTGDWHVGGPMDPRAARALAARGYPTAHTARQFDPAWFADRTLVLALDRGHLLQLRSLAPSAADRDKVVLLRSFDPAAGDDLDVADPYYGGPRGFDDVFDQVQAACAGLVEHLGAQWA